MSVMTRQFNSTHDLDHFDTEDELKVQFAYCEITLVLKTSSTVPFSTIQGWLRDLAANEELKMLLDHTESWHFGSYILDNRYVEIEDDPVALFVTIDAPQQPNLDVLSDTAISAVLGNAFRDLFSRWIDEGADFADSTVVGRTAGGKLILGDLF